MDERHRRILDICIRLARRSRMKLIVPLSMTLLLLIIFLFIIVGFKLWTYSGIILGFILAAALIMKMSVKIKCAGDVLENEMKETDVLLLMEYVEDYFETMEANSNKWFLIQVVINEFLRVAMLGGITSFFQEKGYGVFFDEGTQHPDGMRR
ncbi:uncharacterized protein isoform X1 [Leptinotarsa decemlineata]|uniref:uncharacterized protein isoform X1 n=1 Tax=Leptinotarsa decemlineata TaxID=7539 RepID=UPI003D3090BE